MSTAGASSVTGGDEAPLRPPDETPPLRPCLSSSANRAGKPERGERRVAFTLDAAAIGEESAALRVSTGGSSNSGDVDGGGVVSPSRNRAEVEALRDLAHRSQDAFARVASRLGYEVVSPSALPAAAPPAGLPAVKLPSAFRDTTGNGLGTPSAGTPVEATAATSATSATAAVGGGSGSSGPLVTVFCPRNGGEGWHGLLTGLDTSASSTNSSIATEEALPLSFLTVPGGPLSRPLGRFSGSPAPDGCVDVPLAMLPTTGVDAVSASSPSSFSAHGSSTGERGLFAPPPALSAHVAAHRLDEGGGGRVHLSRVASVSSENAVLVAPNDINNPPPAEMWWGATAIPAPPTTSGLIARTSTASTATAGAAAAAAAAAALSVTTATTNSSSASMTGWQQRQPTTPSPTATATTSPRGNSDPQQQHQQQHRLHQRVHQRVHHLPSNGLSPDARVPLNAARGGGSEDREGSFIPSPRHHIR